MPSIFARAVLARFAFSGHPGTSSFVRRGPSLGSNNRYFTVCIHSPRTSAWRRDQCGRANNTVFEDPVTTALAPGTALMQLLFGKQISYSIAAIARLGVADHMSMTPTSIEFLADKVDAHAPSLYRVMRMLAGVGVFGQTERQFSLTPVGELLRSDHKNSGRYRAMLRGEEWTTRAYEHFADCVSTGEDGVTKAYGRNIFEFLAERPDQADTFNRAMTNSSLASSSGDPRGVRFRWDNQAGRYWRRPRLILSLHFETISPDARCAVRSSRSPCHGSLTPICRL